MIEYPNTPAEALADLPGFVAGMTETRAVHHAAPQMDPTEQLLADVTRLARLKGFVGVCLADDPSAARPYVATVVSERGVTSYPLSGERATPNAALADLFARLAR